MSEPNGRFKVNWQTAATVLIGWLAAALLAYGAVTARVQVLEDRYLRMSNDIAEIKQDLKSLMRRVQ